MKAVFYSLLTLLLFTQPVPIVQANTWQASVDRTQVEQDDILTLTLRFRGARSELSSLGKPEISVLEKDFDIISQSQRSQYRSINGQSESWVDWVVSIAPKQPGTITIPGISLGSYQTQSIMINVAKPNTAKNANPDIFIEVTLEKDHAYLSEEVGYLVKFFHAISLNNDASLTDPKAPGVSFRRDEQAQTQYETLKQGRRYGVTERQYWLSANKVGRTTIEAPVFTGSENAGYFRPGKRLRRQGQPLNITIKPIPATFPSNATWLPLKSLQITEQWSGDFTKWQIGQPITRTIQLLSKGSIAELLPELNIQYPDHFKVYDEPASLETRITEQGTQATRIERAALLPTHATNQALQNIRIPWWDVVNDKLAYAKLVPAEIQLFANPSISSQSQSKQLTREPPEQPNLTNPANDNSLGTEKLKTPGQETTQQPTIGWGYLVIITLLALYSAIVSMLWLQSKARVKAMQNNDQTLATTDTKVNNAKQDEKALLHIIRQSAKAGEAKRCYESTSKWLQHTWDMPLSFGALKQLSKQYEFSGLTQQLNNLESACFGQSDNGNWCSTNFAQLLIQLKNKALKPPKLKYRTQLEALYPETKS